MPIPQNQIIDTMLLPAVFYHGPTLRGQCHRILVNHVSFLRLPKQLNLSQDPWSEQVENRTVHTICCHPNCHEWVYPENDRSVNSLFVIAMNYRRRMQNGLHSVNDWEAIEFKCKNCLGKLSLGTPQQIVDQVKLNELGMYYMLCTHGTCGNKCAIPADRVAEVINTVYAMQKE